MGFKLRLELYRHASVEILCSENTRIRKVSGSYLFSLSEDSLLNTIDCSMVPLLLLRISSAHLGIVRYFCAVYDYMRKEDLTKGY